MASTPPAPAALPAQYDELVAIERLVHGKHNPRRVSPTATLRESIKQDGIQQPLIVRLADDRDVYHITDGWQRYQAATSLGWEQLPVRVYETPLAALSATESASIVREWSSYDWAQYCQSLAVELGEETDSQRAIARQVAGRTTRSSQSVRRYLDALALPDIVHPLLCDGPEGDAQSWQALRHYNEDVRRYKGLSWRVAAQLGRRMQDMDVSVERTVGTAANAVEYEMSSALEFVDLAMEEAELPFQLVHRRTQHENRYNEYLQIPNVSVALEQEEREAIMAYCAEHRQPLSCVVEDEIRSLATELIER
ncbi:ParB/RepB/Spo0J family partition protein [Halovenus sp. HT40]|uniref:ParB/RepB/Spo0J family partition protein n=1 Tax=Halovenus sp. HT40 TaxID=3126691 RepID=UPI00300F29A2